MVRDGEIALIVKFLTVFVGLLVSSGLLGWVVKAAWCRASAWVDRVNAAVWRSPLLEDRLDKVEGRLASGDARFEAHAREMEAERRRTLEMVSAASLESANDRLRFMKDFVSEDNLRAKVLEIIADHCKDRCGGFR